MIINGDDSNNPNLDGTFENDVIDGKKGNDGLFGKGGNDLLYGREGTDTLDGGTGSDTMYGGAGDDTYYVDNVNDLAIENSNQGVDTVISSIDYTLGGALNDLTLTGNAIKGTGNSLDNWITGNDANNQLYGGDGADDLYGEGGNDYLDGGNGNDYLSGGSGNDNLKGGSGNDTLSGFSSGTEFDTLTGGGDADKFVLGAQSDYNFYTGNGFALITDFNSSDGDKIALFDTVDKYSLVSGNFGYGTNAPDTQIKFGNDVIGVLQDTSNVKPTDFILGDPFPK